MTVLFKDQYLTIKEVDEMNGEIGAIRAVMAMAISTNDKYLQSAITQAIKAMEINEKRLKLIEEYENLYKKRQLPIHEYSVALLKECEYTD